ncbi:rust resistance kinase Lr10-like isoform X1 [Cornus florida]|uniref:rust resistance kinase Lr10-like isoform X1 n=1 Tax=Cornus florida TaxID=4283 RepID=UPI00289F2BE6|nr:rust resistance kinase Lr10-like isoform X1 [Cornus florida]
MYLMSRAFSSTVGLMALVVVLFPEAYIAQEIGEKQCSLSCGDIGNISYPFHLKDHPRSCGDGHHQLVCENNRTTLDLSGVKYYVQEISYENRTITLVDVDIKNDYCSFPRNSFPLSNIYYGLYRDSIYFVSCPNPVNSSNYTDFSSCANSTSISSSSKPNSSSYLVSTDLMEIRDSCTILVQYPSPFIIDSYWNLTLSDIHQELLRGFQLSYYGRYKYPLWVRYVLWRLLEFVFPNLKRLIIAGITAGVYIILRISIGLLCLIILLAYRFRRRHLSIDDTIENFLQSQNNFMPIRYSYSDIKQMTKSFKDKLGQGGYGSVFKGKLRSGDLVAVKVLNTSRGNGQDFISEVATIGRIHHVNVVRMIGFCAEGSRRALVYDFMPNGSLDKFIFSREENNLSIIRWDTMYEIAVGVARGIEYLHRGCAMQILHFDIKPHNILLDGRFVAKVSDFGLAKLYPTDDSIVSLTAARGTLGYIAPELFYKNIGGVSYKADVYSFGMLLMEMVGKRKYENAHAEHASDLYFPFWIYDHINQGEDLNLGDVNEEEKGCARKMIITALWCIQLKPVDRPSMSEVLQMLEGEEGLLQMPPKPFLYSNVMSVEDQADNNTIGLSTSSHAVMSVTIDEMLR